MYRGLRGYRNNNLLVQLAPQDLQRSLKTWHCIRIFYLHLCSIGSHIRWN